MRGDFCRALRKNLFVIEVLPFTLALLNDAVLIGERYDGELVSLIVRLLLMQHWQVTQHLHCR